MPNPYKNLIVAGLLTITGLAATAQTAPPPAAGTPPPAMREGHGRMDPAKMRERMEQRLGALKQKLQITPAQESAWTAYTGAIQPAAHQRMDRAEFARLTTPERIDHMRKMRTVRIAEMDKRGDATKTFYGALTAEQKKVFDQETLRRGGHHGGRGPHEWRGKA